MDLPLTLVGGLPSVHLNVGYALNEVNSRPQYLLGAKRVSADDDKVLCDSCMSPPARMGEPANRASALCAASSRYLVRLSFHSYVESLLVRLSLGSCCLASADLWVPLLAIPR